MTDRVRTQKDTAGGRYEREWVVFVDGQKLKDGRGGVRRFKTESAARDAGVRKQAQRDRMNAADGVAGVSSAEPNTDYERAMLDVHFMLDELGAPREANGATLYVRERIKALRDGVGERDGS
jgi:hypothetical protein